MTEIVHEKLTPPQWLQPILRFVLFQATWWLLVLSTKIEEKVEITHFSNVTATVIGFASAWLILRRKSLWRWTLLSLPILGFLLDSIWVRSGLVMTEPTYSFHAFTLAPPWLLALWLAFTAAMTQMMSLDSNRLLKMNRRGAALALGLMLIGAIAGPLSYKVGEPFDVMTISDQGLMVLAIEWAILFPMILGCVLISTTSRSRT